MVVVATTKRRNNVVPYLSMLTTRNQLQPMWMWKKELSCGVKCTAVELIHCLWIQVNNSIFRCWHFFIDCCPYCASSFQYFSENFGTFVNNNFTNFKMFIPVKSYFDNI